MKLISILTILVAFTNQINTTSLGEINLGMSIEDFLKLPQKDRVVKKETISLEGDDYDIYNIYQGEKIVFAVEPDCDPDCKVWRIWIYDNMFKTEKGIGIGNTLGDIRELYDIDTFAVGEGRVAILLKNFEFSFLLDSRQIPKDWWFNQSLESLDDSLPIDLIIIV